MATTTVSKINIKLAAQTAELETGLHRGAAATRKFGNDFHGVASKIERDSQTLGMRVEGLAKSLGNFAKGAAIAAGLMVLQQGIGGIKAQFEALDKVAKAASATDFDAANIIAWGRAADEAGADMDTFVKGAQKMTRLMGEALGGNEKALDAFEAVGLTLKDLQTLSPDEVFVRVADAISELPTAAERAAAANDIFGKSQEKLIHLLNLGEEGLAAYSKQAEQLNIGVSDEQLADIEAANDSMSTLWATLKGVANHIVAALAPAITEHFGNLTTLAADVSRLIEEWAPAITAGAGVLVDYLGQVIDAIRVGIKNLMDWTAWMQAAFGDDIIERIGAFAGEFAKLVYQIGNMPVTLLTAVFGPAAIEAEELAQATLSATKHAEDLADEMGEVDNHVDAAAQHMQELQREGDRLTEALKTPFERLRDDLANAEQLLAAGVISWETYLRAVDKAEAELNDLTAAQQKFSGDVNIAAVTRRTQEGYAILNGRDNRQELDEVVGAVNAAAAQEAALLREMIATIRNGGVQVFRHRLDP